MAINMFCGGVNTFFRSSEDGWKCIRRGHKMGSKYFLLKGCFYKVTSIEE